MPDFSACSQTICPNRHTCARYLMKPGTFQSYMACEPDNCKYYWDKEKGAPFAMRTVKEADDAYTGKNIGKKK